MFGSGPYRPLTGDGDDSPKKGGPRQQGEGSSGAPPPPPPPGELFDPSTVFVAERSTHHDTWASYVYLGLQILVVVVGLFAQYYVSDSSPFAFGGDHVVMTSDLSRCGAGPAPPPPAAGLGQSVHHVKPLWGAMTTAPVAPPPKLPPAPLIAIVVGLVVAAAGAAAGAGFAFIYLVREHALTMVYAAVIAQVAATAASGVAMLASGSLWGLLFLAMAAFIAWAFWSMRDQLQLCARLMAMAAVALGHNAWLLLTALLAKATVVAVGISIVGFALSALGNGALLPSTCERPGDAAGPPVLFACCAWRVQGWVPAYVAAAAAFGLWTLMLGLEFTVYVTGGTIAQWYYAPLGSPTAPNVRRSVSHALGPSWGTLCLASLILSAVAAVRSAMRSVRDRAGSVVGGIMAAIASCIADCIGTLIEQCTKFATVSAAITGLPFCAAARHATALLLSQSLSTYTVWWLPGMVLALGASILAAAIGFAAWAAAAAAFALAGAGPHAGGLYSGLVGLGAAAAAGLSLAFLRAVLLNVVDAVYLCYAMDLERRDASDSRREVHELFGLLPVGLDGDGRPSPPGERLAPSQTPGALVVLPDGSRYYAAGGGEAGQAARGAGLYRAVVRGRAEC